MKLVQRGAICVFLHSPREPPARIKTTDVDKINRFPENALGAFVRFGNRAARIFQSASGPYLIDLFAARLVWLGIAGPAVRNRGGRSGFRQTLTL